MIVDALGQMPMETVEAAVVTIHAVEHKDEPTRKPNKGDWPLLILL